MAGIAGFLGSRTWTNQDIVLYHGTIDTHARSIRKRIDVKRGSPTTDFGRGFYTTTSRMQARSWAWQLSVDYNASIPAGMTQARPVLIRFQVSRDSLAKFQSLSFVRGDFHARDYWSLVHSCRLGASGHGRPIPPNRSSWYDIVVGPMLAVWRTRLVIANCDQYSFHTSRAGKVLDASPQRFERVK
jgi:Protein of unknown function (DUF3990)